ncbi:MAG: hypothetical protein GKS06_06025 [Acidobacteria bacterium]|nr:hypothetical protein [Acidobacteriota bacterium]
MGSWGRNFLRQSLSNLLFEVEGFDIVTYSSVAALLILVAMVACSLPAQRAASIDPMDALRDD